MTPSRVRIGAALTAALVPHVSGCGGGQSYCDAVHDHQSALGSIVSSGDRGALITALPILRDLLRAGPDGLATAADRRNDKLRQLAT